MIHDTDKYDFDADGTMIFGKTDLVIPDASSGLANFDLEQFNIYSCYNS